MALAGEAESEYSSRYTSECPSTQQSSIGDISDVLIFYHELSNMKEPVKSATAMLKKHGLKVLDYREVAFTAGKAKMDQIFESAKSCRFKIFVINTSFVKHDLPLCEAILCHPSVCCSENSLFLCRDAHKKKIPAKYDRFTIKSLANRPSGEEIFEYVTSFIKGNKSSAGLAKASLPISEPVNPSKGFNGKESKEMETKKKLFLEAMNDFDGKRAYILCVCVKPISCDPKILNPLSLIPWLKVFDFDADTQKSGLFSTIKSKLPKGRFSFNDLTDKPEQLRNKVMNWTALSDGEGNTVSLNSHISALSKFCFGRKPATMLILWYNEEEQSDLEDDLFEFLSSIKQSFLKRPAKISLCLPFTPENNSTLGKISKRFLEERRIVISLEKICEWIRDVGETLYSSKEDQQAKLPKLKEDDDDEDAFDLSEEDLKWITIDIEVLSSRSTMSLTQENNEIVHRNGVEFLNGGNLTWDVLENGTYDVRRDISTKIEEFIKDLIDHGDSRIVTLYHSPGSGGSTLGRQILWAMRKEAPSLCLNQRSEIRDDFKEKICLLRDKSNLPILLLIDGRTSQEVRNILEMCRYERIIILHVVRHYALDRKKNLAVGTFFLGDYVSRLEAPSFQKILTKNGVAGIKKSMVQLTENIMHNGHHSVFEYGLTAFNTNFKGIRKYVDGHLLLKNKTENWHRVAAFLSLANYYGNTSLPAEFFCDVLEKAPHSTVDISNDIPELGRQLIRECNDGEDWKISHYLVAKEILEQFLGGNVDESDVQKLSSQACKKLPVLALDFLQLIKNHVGDDAPLEYDLLGVLNSIFIMRPDKEGYNEDDYKRRYIYSRLITDIGIDSHQTEIFERLVEYFPMNPEFYAHFGRFLAKNHQHDSAEKQLEKAVEIRLQHLKDRGIDPLVKGDDVLQRIHSMFGYALNAHVRHKFGNRALGFLSGEKYSNLRLQEIREAYQLSLRAVEQFVKCRSYHCPSGNPSYAFVGEIRVRLQITEFCRKRANYNLLSITSDHELNFMWNFIMESFVECDALLDQAIAVSGENSVIQPEIENYMRLYIEYFFKNHHEYKRLQKRIDQNTFSSKRGQITLMRWQRARNRGSKFNVFTDLHPYEYGGYAKLIDDVLQDKDCRNIKISSYMNDWIKVARYLPKVNALSVVKRYVDDWDKRREKDSYSFFYKYVIHFLACLRNVTPSDLQDLSDKRKLLEERQSSLRQSTIEKPIEWIGEITQEKEGTLALLQSDEDVPQPKHIFRGRIVGVAKSYSGTIEMDGTRFPIYFVPKKFSVRSYHALEKQRVQFNIGFNAKHGAQAYDVTFIFDFVCITCKANCEGPKGAITCNNCKPSFQAVNA